MDVLPFKIVILIASKDPRVFMRMVQTISKFSKYTLTPAGQECLLNTCMVRSHMQVKMGYDIVVTRLSITYDLHSFFDHPAVINPLCNKSWWKNGKKHRDIGPASINTYGDQEWCQNNKLHRDNGPTIICANGGQAWYYTCERHRIAGPAIIHGDGVQLWYLYGVLQSALMAITALMIINPNDNQPKCLFFLMIKIENPHV